MRTRSSSEMGFSLIEVCVALLLFAVALLPLVQTTVALAQRTVRLDRRAEAESTRPDYEGAGVGSADWTWGPRPGLLSWSDGPVLEADLRTPGGAQSQLLGVWVSGWFAGEVEAGGLDRVALGGSELWRSHQGEEVVIRARRADEAWGAPMRTIVPAVDPAGSEPSGQAAPAGSAPSAALVHLPAAGGAALEVTVGTASRHVDLDEGPAAILTLPAGSASAVFGATTQAWVSEETRDVDLYF